MIPVVKAAVRFAARRYLGGIPHGSIASCGTTVPPMWWYAEQVTLARRGRETGRRDPWAAAAALFGGDDGR